MAEEHHGEDGADPASGAPVAGEPADQHAEIGAALDGIEATLDEVATALARMA